MCVNLKTKQNKTKQLLFKFCLIFRTHAIFVSECIFRSNSKNLCQRGLMCDMVIQHVTFSGPKICMPSTQKKYNTRAGNFVSIGLCIPLCFAWEPAGTTTTRLSFWMHQVNKSLHACNIMRCLCVGHFWEIDADTTPKYRRVISAILILRRIISGSISDFC